jgi:IS30 family transposase
MGKLSNAKSLTDIEKYSIEGMLQNNMSVESIATALKREESLVEDYANRVTQMHKDLLITKTKSGKGGVTIMTEGASKKADGQKKEGTPETTGKSKYIHYIKDNG